jgi:hypothetical protein
MLSVLTELKLGTVLANQRPWASIFWIKANSYLLADHFVEWKLWSPHYSAQQGYAGDESDAESALNAQLTNLISPIYLLRPLNPLVNTLHLGRF